MKTPARTIGRAAGTEAVHRAAGGAGRLKARGRGLGGEGAETVNRAEKPVLRVAIHSQFPPFPMHSPFQSKDRRRISGRATGLTNPKIRPKHLMTFGPYPRDPLPFPSILVGSRNDHYCSFETAEDLAAPGFGLRRRRRERALQRRLRSWAVAGRHDGVRKLPVEAALILVIYESFALVHYWLTIILDRGAPWSTVSHSRFQQSCRSAFFSCPCG